MKEVGTPEWGVSSLIFLDSLGHLADGDHVGGVVEVLDRLHRLATLHQFGHAMKKVQRGCAASSSARSAGTCPPVPRERADLAGELVTHQQQSGSARGWR